MSVRDSFSNMATAMLATSHTLSGLKGFVLVKRSSQTSLPWMRPMAASVRRNVAEEVCGVLKPDHGKEQGLHPGLSSLWGMCLETDTQDLCLRISCQTYEKGPLNDSSPLSPRSHSNTK